VNTALIPPTVRGDALGAAPRPAAPAPNASGHCHAITLACYGRQPFLGDDLSRWWLIDAIDRARRKHHWRVWAYVIMPEHAHLLLWPQLREHDVQAVTSAIKQSVSQRARAYVQFDPPPALAALAERRPDGRFRCRLWDSGTECSHNIVTADATFDEIERIHSNPVRRGLCRTAEEWPWSSAGDFADVRSGPLRVDGMSLLTGLAGLEM
jgi:putative transposase